MRRSDCSEPRFFGDILSIEDFDNLCVFGFFIDYDGYAEPIAMSPPGELARFSPNTYLKKRARIRCTFRYVVWYNR